MTADSTERVKRFPSIPSTALRDVAARQLVDAAGETRTMPAPISSR